MKKLTEHAKKRANSRGLSKKAIELAMKIGRVTYSNGINMDTLKKKLEDLINEQGELYFKQIKSVNKTDLEIINKKIEDLTEKIFSLSNKIFDLENNKL